MNGTTTHVHDTDGRLRSVIYGNATVGSQVTENFAWTWAGQFQYKELVHPWVDGDIRLLRINDGDGVQRQLDLRKKGVGNREESMTKTSVRIVMYCLALIVSARLQAAPPPRVCEVLKNAQAYDNKVISVRGRWSGGSRHGHYISDAYHDRPCPGFLKTGLTWPSTIYPDHPSADRLRKDQPLPFKQDRVALNEFRRTLEKARNRPGGYVEATFTGVFRTRDDIHIVCETDGACGGTGYGQVGMHPAILLIQTITDVVLK